MAANLKCLMDELGGVATVKDLSDYLQVSERSVRDWAHDNDVPRAGNSFAFTMENAQALADDLSDGDDDTDDDDDPEDPDDDNGFDSDSEDDDESEDDGCDPDDD
jgi:hypothetical protein